MDIARRQLGRLAAAGTWGDQGDGTYVNPIIPADLSDWDCIRVGADYYGITSTFGYSPGMAVLHSKDLVNWRTLGGAVDDVTRVGPELNWDRMNRFGRGVWAGAIRFHGPAACRSCSGTTGRTWTPPLSGTPSSPRSPDGVLSASK
ncbi:family 43 glycosylhydrolase [Streptomyces sp. NBC_00201]|uniref:family 43 glycosylhydrolase n=1 Tax=Streptomyces sp. NBC_00201 TaxID=2975679 RepID=UPI00225992F9|nr:family 43 glycosylhydrolase [Streptomyces sp. NBC_00201]MCX5250089.1 family 43 glycosylhydrolase [Streptomyces sp. NBC_00201]